MEQCHRSCGAEWSGLPAWLLVYNDAYRPGHFCASRVLFSFPREAGGVFEVTLPPSDVRWRCGVTPLKVSVEV